MCYSIALEASLKRRLFSTSSSKVTGTNPFISAPALRTLSLAAISGQKSTLVPQLLVMLYAGQKGFKVILREDEAIGVPLDVYIPELRLAFLFPHKNTQREKDTLMVVKHLCEKRNITCEIILKKDDMDLCAAIKMGFSKVHVFIRSDSVNDMSIVKRKYREIRENHMT